MRDSGSFSRAAAHGIASVPEAPESFRAFFSEAERVPVWVDPDRMERGRRLFLRYGMLAGIVLGGRSLVLGYISPAGNKPLVFSGRLEQQAPRRLAETGRFVQAISEYRGVDVLGDGYQIALKVRLMHAQVRAMLARSDRWNAEAWGVPINQHDMAGTTLLFSIAVLDGLRTLGARFSASEADDYMHLWRVIGRPHGRTRRDLARLRGRRLRPGRNHRRHPRAPGRRRALAHASPLAHAHRGRAHRARKAGPPPNA